MMRRVVIVLALLAASGYAQQRVTLLNSPPPYIGVVAWDSNPNLIVAREMRRDGAVEADDSITIVLDTYLDHRNAFYFAFNSLGARGSPASGDPNLNADWWYRATPPPAAPTRYVE